MPSENQQPWARAVIGLLTICMALLSCTSRIESPNVQGNSNTPGNDDNFIEMTKEERSNFLSKVRSIDVGDSYSRVIEILGKPTYDQNLAAKDNRFRIRVLKYYIRKVERNVVNEKYDEVVWFEIDKDSQVVSISSNIQGFDM